MMDGQLLAGIEKVKLLMRLPNPMMSVVRFHISYLYPTQPSCLDDLERYPSCEDARTETAN
jgi:hypothetical protein